MAKGTGLITINVGGSFGKYFAFDEEDKPPRVDEKFDSGRAPDLIENVLAWRGWDVTPTGHLTASAVQGVWDPGPNKAVCRHAGHTDDVPAVGCGCGFYGWHEPAGISHGQIRGAVKCWGEIIVHDVGIRAEWAEILCLFQSTTHEPWLRRAAERYEVPIVGTQAEAEAFVADLGIRVPEAMRPERSPEQEWKAINRQGWLPEEAARSYLSYIYTGYTRAPISGGEEAAKPKNKAEELAERRQADRQQQATLYSWDHKYR
jgi:hypothetical protein